MNIFRKLVKKEGKILCMYMYLYNLASIKDDTYTVFTLRCQTVLVRYGTVRYG